MTGGVELLLHNLSHSDIVFDICNSYLETSNKVIARPKFSRFKQLSEAVYNKVLTEDCRQISSLSCSSRDEKKPTLGAVPLGFDLTLHPVCVSDVSSLRFRQDDFKKMSPPDSVDLPVAMIRMVYFPLIAVLLPKWISNIDESSQDAKKVLILVSGRGTPSDTSANMSDNSTKFTGKLIMLFMQSAYPTIEVQLVHSTTNLFRYDHNIIFVKNDLLPIINKYRDDLVSTMGGRWKECLRITLSFADGSSARISAINASLRHYR